MYGESTKSRAVGSLGIGYDHTLPLLEGIICPQCTHTITPTSRSASCTHIVHTTCMCSRVLGIPRAGILMSHLAQLSLESPGPKSSSHPRPSFLAHPPGNHIKRTHTRKPTRVCVLTSHMHIQYKLVNQRRNSQSNRRPSP